jgi:hypothetical protein
MRVLCCPHCGNCMAIWNIEENTKTSMGNLRNYSDDPWKSSIFAIMTIQTKQSNFVQMCSSISGDIPVDKTFHFLIRRRLYYGKSCSCQRTFLYYPPRNLSMTRHTNQGHSLKSQNGLNACAFEFLAIQRSLTGHGGYKNGFVPLRWLERRQKPRATIPSHAWQFASVIPCPI